MRRLPRVVYPGINPEDYEASKVKSALEQLMRDQEASDKASGHDYEGIKSVREAVKGVVEATWVGRNDTFSEIRRKRSWLCSIISSFPRLELELQSDRPLLISINRFEAKKNVALAIEAFAIMRKNAIEKDPKSDAARARLVVAGESHWCFPLLTEWVILS